MSADVGSSDVVGRELARLGNLEELVVGNGSATDYERINFQVEWGVAGGVLGCQRIEDKLEVRFALWGFLQQ